MSVLNFIESRGALITSSTIRLLAKCQYENACLLRGGLYMHCEDSLLKKIGEMIGEMFPLVLYISAQGKPVMHDTFEAYVKDGDRSVAVTWLPQILVIDFIHRHFWLMGDINTLYTYVCISCASSGQAAGNLLV